MTCLGRTGESDIAIFRRPSLIHDFLLASFLPREEVDIITSFLLPSYLARKEGRRKEGRKEGGLASKFSERNTNYNRRDSENKLAVPLPRTNDLKN